MVSYNTRSKSQGFGVSLKARTVKVIRKPKQNGSTSSPIIIPDSDDEDSDNIWGSFIDLDDYDDDIFDTTMDSDEDNEIILIKDDDDDIADRKSSNAAKAKKQNQWIRTKYGPRGYNAVVNAAMAELDIYKANHRQPYHALRRKQIYLDNRPHFQNGFDQIVYTDGSHSGTGRSGVGVYWSENHPQNIIGPLTRCESSIYAEIYAVYKALLSDELIYSSLRIETDCWGVIQLLCQYSHGRRKYVRGKISRDRQKAYEQLYIICDKILKLLSQRPAPVSLGYVPGHQGIFGNEHADKMAKEATQSLGPRPKK